MAAFAAARRDSRFVAAVVVAALSGFVRGFSGFGSALIYIPLISAIYEPRIAAVTLLPVDFIGALWPAIQARRNANWSDLTPIAIAAIIAAPFGTMLLLIVAPTTLRWVISGSVLF